MRWRKSLIGSAPIAARGVVNPEAPTPSREPRVQSRFGQRHPFAAQRQGLERSVLVNRCGRAKQRVGVVYISDELHVDADLGAVCDRTSRQVPRMGKLNRRVWSAN